MNKVSGSLKNQASTERGMNRATANLSARLQSWAPPVVEMETLIAAVAIYFVLVTNSSFWSSLWGTGALVGVSGVQVSICIGMAIFALHALLITLAGRRS